MSEDFVPREFRPDSRDFLIAQSAVALLSIVCGVAAFFRSPTAYLWICLAFVFLMAALALCSVRLFVTPEGIILKLFGMARNFPTDQIDSVRLDELAFMNLFQISLRNGRFILIPRGAFSDLAPFSAMDAVISRSALVKSGQNEIDTAIADRSGPSAVRLRKETL